MIAAALPRPAASNAALFGLWGLFWVAMITVALQDGLRSGHIRWWEPLLWEGSSASIATLWLLAQRAVDHHYAQYLDRPLLWFGQHIKWLPLVALSFVTIVYSIRHGVYGLLGETYRHESWFFVFTYETVKLALFVSLWLGIIFGFNSFAQWRSQREHLLAVQKALAESQLLHLQAQLRPHFLFNALNTISSLMHVDPARADRLLARLGDLLRASLQASQKDLTSLREELQVLELYTQIMEERFVGRVAVIWQIDAATLDARVPAMLLQPLLENAFKHGIEKSQDPEVIRIESQRCDGRLQLTISNSGTTLSSERSDGIGLRNCRERLQLLYGDSADFDLTQGEAGVTAHICIPYREYTP